MIKNEKQYRITKAQVRRFQDALTELAEQDPLINLRQDDTRQELFLSFYGEVQKEIVAQTLKGDYGLDIEFRATTPVCEIFPDFGEWLCNSDGTELVRK